MKTTITLLTALAGLAAAASPELVWDMDFQTDGISLKMAPGVATNLAAGTGAGNIENGALTLSHNRIVFNQTEGMLSYADSFSLVASFKMNSITNNDYPIIFGLGESTSWNWKAAYYVNDSMFVLDKDGFSNLVDETDKKVGGVTYAPDENGVVTLALTNNGEGLLSLYVNGELAGKTQITSENEYSSSKQIKMFSLGGRLTSGNNTSDVTFYDVQFIKGISTALIPEPATATLSLLALCGLAARRRRV